MALDAIGASSSIAGLLSLGITICQGLLNYYDSYKHAESDIQAAYGSIKSLESTFTILRPRLQSGRFREDVKANVERSVASCASGLQELQDELQKIRLSPQSQAWLDHAKAKLRRLQYPFKETTLGKLKATTADLRNNLNLALSVLQIDANMTGLDTLGEKIDNMEELFVGMQVQLKTTERIVDAATLQLSDEEWEKVLDWLSPLRGKFETKQAEIFDLNGRQDGFAHEILEGDTFRDWMSGTDKTLWCYGKRVSPVIFLASSPNHALLLTILRTLAGAGKTVFCSIIVDFLQKTFEQEDIGIAFMFCNHKDRNDQTPVNLLSSLLNQLVSQKSILRADIVRIYNSHRAKKTDPSLAEICTLLRDAISFYSKTLIIVDALDECPQGESRRVLLSKLRDLGPGNNLLITSRRTPSITLELETSGNLEIRATDRDITNYLRERITVATEEINYFIKNDETLYPLVVKTILEKANGRFLLARLHLESLLAETDLRSFKKALTTLPLTIWSMYDDMMARIEAQSSRRASLAKRALFWVVYALRPLTTEELQHALSVEQGDSAFDKDGISRIEILLSTCACFLEVQNNTLVLVHHTAREYFRNRGDGLFPGAHANIAATCLTYMLFDDFGEGPCDSEEHLRKRLQDYPFLNYAARNWGFHFIHDQEQVKLLAEKFLCKDSNLANSIQIIHEDIGHPLDEEDQRHKHFKARQHDLRDVHKLWVAARFDLVDVVQQLLDTGVKIMDTTGYGETGLHMASRMGHCATAALLLQSGADIFAKNENGDTPLHIAADCGHDSILKLLLHNCQSVDATNSGGETALHLASHKGHTTIVELLLRHRADTAIESDEDKASALHFAAEQGHIWAVQTLLDFGAAVEAKDKYGGTALHDSATNGHLPVVKFLVGYGAQIGTSGIYGNIPLHSAACYGHLSVVKFLVECGPRIEATDEQGHTPLHWAANNGHLPVVKLLVECGSGIEATNEKGITPLHCAARNGHLHVVKVLVEKRASVEVTDNDGVTPLHDAARGGHLTVVQFLIENEAPAEATNSRGCTPLHVAGEHGQLGVVEYLLDKGCNIDAVTDADVTALWRACWDGIEDIVSLLLKRGAKAEAWSQTQHFSALSFAAGAGNLKIVQLLLDAGVAIEPQTALGVPALSLAALRGDILMTELLLNHEADTEVRNAGHRAPLFYGFLSLLIRHGVCIGEREGDAYTPLEDAAHQGHEKIMQLLLDKGARTGKSLFLAAAQGHIGVVNILISRGVSIESKNAAGFTPLACAAAKGKVDMVKWLLEKGADVKSRSETGWTAIKLAVEQKEAEVVRILLDNGADPEGEQNLNERMIFWPKAKRAWEIIGKANRFATVDHHNSCDICERAIPDIEPHYHCSVCEGEDDFDLCQECLDREGSCPGNHRLTKRKYINGQKTDLEFAGPLEGAVEANGPVIESLVDIKGGDEAAIVVTENLVVAKESS